MSLVTVRGETASGEPLTFVAYDFSGPHIYRQNIVAVDIAAKQDDGPLIPDDTRLRLAEVIATNAQDSIEAAYQGVLMAILHDPLTTSGGRPVTMLEKTLADIKEGRLPKGLSIHDSRGDDITGKRITLAKVQTAPWGIMGAPLELREGSYGQPSFFYDPKSGRLEADPRSIAEEVLDISSQNNLNCLALVASRKGVAYMTDDPYLGKMVIASTYPTDFLPYRTPSKDSSTDEAKIERALARNYEIVDSAGLKIGEAEAAAIAAASMNGQIIGECPEIDPSGIIGYSCSTTLQLFKPLPEVNLLGTLIAVPKPPVQAPTLARSRNFDIADLPLPRQDKSHGNRYSDRGEGTGREKSGYRP